MPPKDRMLDYMIGPTSGPGSWEEAEIPEFLFEEEDLGKDYSAKKKELEGQLTAVGGGVAGATAGMAMGGPAGAITGGMAGASMLSELGGAPASATGMIDALDMAVPDLGDVAKLIKYAPDAQKAILTGVPWLREPAEKFMRELIKDFKPGSMEHAALTRILDDVDYPVDVRYMRKGDKLEAEGALGAYEGNPTSRATKGTQGEIMAPRPQFEEGGVEMDWYTDMREEGMSPEEAMESVMENFGDIPSRETWDHESIHAMIAAMPEGARARARKMFAEGVAPHKRLDVPAYQKMSAPARGEENLVHRYIDQRYRGKKDPILDAMGWGQTGLPDPLVR